MESETEVAGIETRPNVAALVAAIVVAILMVGVVTLFFVRFRPITDGPEDALPVDEPIA
ncbi:MAG TPA: hypothetical protein VJZ72_08265 [Candidatus Limnocylindrales bacterium]|nr:hypothetical protein [Candidatus Limnocylindrales bacterium]